MSAGNVIDIGSRVDLSSLQAGMRQAEAAVKQASANMAEAQEQFGKAAESGNLQAVAALKQYESELRAAQAALANFAETETQEISVMRGGMSARMAASAELRVFEGNLQGSTRAAGALLTMLPGMSQAMKLAFPIFGGVALLSILGKAASEVHDLENAFKALDGAETKAGFDAILAGEKIVKVKTDKFSMDAFARMIEGAPANKDIDVQNASVALKQIQYQRDLHDAQAQVAEQGLTGAALQKQKIADIQKEIEFTRQAKEEALKLAKAYADQAEAHTKVVTSVAGHSGMVRSTESYANITDPKQIEALQQQTRTAAQAAEQYGHDLDMLQVKMQGAQVKESHAGDKAALQATKEEQDAIIQEMIQAGQRQLESNKRVTEEITENWLRMYHADEEEARKQEEYSKEATRKYIENKRQELEAAKEVLEEQSRLAVEKYRGTEQTTAGQVQEGALTPARRVAELQQAAAQEVSIMTDAAQKMQQLDSDAALAGIISQDEATKLFIADVAKETQAVQQGVQQQIQLAQQSAQALSQPYINAFNSINNSWLQVQDKLIFGTHNISRQFANMGVSTLESVAQAWEKMAVKFVEAEIRMTLAHQAAKTAQVAATSTAAAQTQSISLISSLKEISHAAGVAAANAYKAEAGIPIIGPAVGAIAAAATFAGVMAFAAFETGGIIPNTGVALVHQGEAVLPAHLTNLLMNTANDNRSSSSASMHLNFNGMSDSAFKELSSRHAGHLVKVVQRGLRNSGRA